MSTLTTNVYPVWRGCLLLIRRSPSDMNCPGMWECPGGHVDVACGPVDSVLSRKEALRELKEEVGLLVKPEDLIPLKRSSTTSTHQAYVLPLKGAQPPQIKLSSEHDTFRWLSMGSHIKESPMRREVFSFIIRNKKAVR